jgi:uncharacterized protein (TIGR03067 family)
MMKACFARVVGILCLAGLAANAPAGGEGGGKIEGTWVAVSAISRGKKVPPAELAEAMATFTFKDDKYKAQIRGEPRESGTYKVDASKQPATIDLTISEGPDKGRKQLGIYKIEGDTLTLAIAIATSSASSNGKSQDPKRIDPLPRPKNFEGKGERHEVMVFKRGK